MILAAPAVPAAALQRGSVLHDHAVEHDGDVAGVEHFAVLINRAAEDDVIHLPLAGRTHGVGHGRVDAIHGAGEAVGVGGVVVVVEHLNFQLIAHRKDAAVAASLAVALRLGGCGPLDVELAVAPLGFRPNIAGPGDALHGSVLHDPFGRLGGRLVGLPVFCKRLRGAVKEDNGIRGRLARLLGTAESAGRDERRLRTVHIMDGPGMRGIRRIAVECAIGEGGGGEAEDEGGGGECGKRVHKEHLARTARAAGQVPASRMPGLTCA